MSINITFSTTNGGVAITEPLDYGDVSGGNETAVKTIYLSHNGNASITNCGVFLAEKSDTYSGTDTAKRDRVILISWGDVVGADDFGGLQFNFDAVNGFPVTAWGTVANKDPSGGRTVRTGVGDSAANRILLPVSTGVTVVGVVPKGTPNVRFQVRIKTPLTTDVKIREFDIGVAYSFTD